MKRGRGGWAPNSRGYNRLMQAMGLRHRGNPQDPGKFDREAARRRADPNWDRACHQLPEGTQAELEALASKYRKGEL